MASILLIEDDLAFGSALIDLLEHHRYEVHQATNAAAALELARQRAFHLVLTDVRIAGDTDGVGALEAIQALRPDIRSIIMTGYADREVPVRAARLHADDYLHKPFKLHVLLQAVRAVLERETHFRGLFQRVAEVPARALRWVFDAQLQKLNDLRQASLKQVFLLLRSNHFGREIAFRVFSLWEKLELEYLQAQSPAQWSRLVQAYQEFQQQLTQPLLAEARPSPLLTPQLFDQLLSRIMSGRVEWVHLLQAIRLLHVAEARRENVEAYCTYHWLWVADQVAEDPFLGLQLQGYKLKTLRPGSSPSARLYEAVHESAPHKNDLVLCLPAENEFESLVQQEQSSERAQLLESRMGHHFLLYRGHALSLKMNLPPDGVTPQRAWELLRPVFYQVESYHQQGRYSGYFSLKDIDCIPDRPCSLSCFSDQAYRHQHRSLGHAGALDLALYSAPEVHVQSQPTAASDQAVLGRLLFEVIHGGQYPDPETRIKLRYLGHEQANDHFRQFIPKLEPLARVFYRLCHSDPGQRYSSLREAILAIEAVLPPG